MSTERDALAEVLWGHHYEEYTINPDGTERSNCQCGAAVYPRMSLVQHQAQSALTAGYRHPQQINRAEELDALPFESVIRDAEGHVLERWGEPEEKLWATVMVNAFIPCGDIALPVTVLHVGGAE